MSRWATFARAFHPHFSILSPTPWGRATATALCTVDTRPNCVFRSLANLTSGGFTWSLTPWLQMQCWFLLPLQHMFAEETGPGFWDLGNMNSCQALINSGLWKQLEACPHHQIERIDSHYLGLSTKSIRLLLVSISLEYDWEESFDLVSMLTITSPQIIKCE